MAYVEIRNGKQKTYNCRFELKQYGLAFNKTGKYTGFWKGNVEDDKLEQLKEYCLKKKILLRVIDERYTRSSDYRDTFFDNNHGFFDNDKYYHCSYCGKIIKKENVSVDHLFPIHKVRNGNYTKFYRNLLSHFKINNINDKRNLIASCERCNKRKGKKGGLWIIRGFIGKYYMTWVIIYLLVINGLFYLFMNYDLLGKIVEFFENYL